MFNGLTRGLQLVSDFLRMFVHAVERRNVQAITDGISVGRQWLHETTDEGGKVVINPTGLIFGGADPWKTSRQMLEKYKAEYPTLL